MAKSNAAHVPFRHAEAAPLKHYLGRLLYARKGIFHGGRDFRSRRGPTEKELHSCISRDPVSCSRGQGIAGGSVRRPSNLQRSGRSGHTWQILQQGQIRPRREKRAMLVIGLRMHRQNGNSDPHK